MSITIRDYDPGLAGESETVLAINAACVPEVNAIDQAVLDLFLEWEARIRVVAEDDLPVAFMIGMEQDLPYDSLNYGWFRDRFDRFAYVDRIAVAESARGKGHGPTLYNDFVKWARDRDQPRVCAEVNTVPPNPRSLRFHEIYGFRPLAEVAPKGTDDYKVMMLEYPMD